MVDPETPTKHRICGRTSEMMEGFRFIISVTSLSRLNTGQDKAIPLQAWTGPEGSRRLRLPDFNTVGT